MKISNHSLKKHPAASKRLGAFIISEIILSVTTMSVMMGVVLTSLTIYMYVAESSEVIVTADGPASVLPATEISMDATAFHFTFQEHVHNADLIYVIGGKDADPGNPGPAVFSFSPPIDSDELEEFELLESLEDFPHRAMSSSVITNLLKGSAEFSSYFGNVATEDAPYEALSFTVMTVELNKKFDVTSLTDMNVFLHASKDWVILEPTVYEPDGKEWNAIITYRCAIAKTDFDRVGTQLRLGAEHHWVRHDQTDAGIHPATNLWDRCEEALCRVSFPDPTWNPETVSSSGPIRSKFTYFLPVTK